MMLIELICNISRRYECEKKTFSEKQNNSIILSDETSKGETSFDRHISRSIPALVMQ
jgi:hypothetical protein